MATNLSPPERRHLDVDDLTDAQFELARSPDRAAEAGNAFELLLASRRPLAPELSEDEADQLSEEAVAWARRAG